MEGEQLAEEENLTLIGVVGIRDTLRPGVENAVKLCRKAGIKVIMVTGDNITTAKTISENCKIVDPSDPEVNNEATIMDGEAFSRKLGGLIKFCNGCNSVIEESKLEKYKNDKIEGGNEMNILH